MRLRNYVAEDLDGVFDRNLSTLRGSETRQVHEARHVAADEEVGVLLEDVVELERSHFPGDVREGDGEGSAEAAALFALSEGDECDVAD